MRDFIRQSSLLNRCAALMLLTTTLSCSQDDLVHVEHSSGGDGGSDTLPGNVEACGEFGEPGVPCIERPFDPVDPRYGQFYLAYTFTEDGNCGSLHRTYWLNDTDRGTVRFHVALNEGFVGEDQRARIQARFILDGRVTRAAWDEEFTDALDFELAPGESREVELHLGATGIPQGAHTATALFTAETPDRTKALPLTWSFVINACGREFPHFAESSGIETVPEVLLTPLLDATTGEPLLFTLERPAGTTMRVRLYFDAQLHPGAGTRQISLFGLQGDEQFLFGPMGYAPAFLSSAGQAHAVEFDIDFPERGEVVPLRFWVHLAFLEQPEDSLPLDDSIHLPAMKTVGPAFLLVGQ